MYLVEPVSQTLAFGQLGIVLVALVVLDLAPGPRVLSRRLLPAGVWTAIATVLKLTPAIFVVYLLAARRWRAAVTAMVVAVALTAVAWLALPGPSADFWGRLAHGDTGLGHSLIYYTNQSVLADIVRAGRLAGWATLVGLALSGVVALLGVWAAALWHRVGEVRLAVTLCGIAGLLASPVSWLHHFVWVVPLALCLVDLPDAAWRRSGSSGSAGSSSAGCWSRRTASCPTGPTWSCAGPGGSTPSPRSPPCSGWRCSSVRRSSPAAPALPPTYTRFVQIRAILRADLDESR